MRQKSHEMKFVRGQPARGQAKGGFSLQAWEWTDSSGQSRKHLWRPNITVKALGSKRQLIAFTTPLKLDPENRVGRYGYRGRFLDLKTAAYTLTDRSYSLQGACEAFGVAG